ncbi:hypothetical protein [Antarcticimicrobium sediminis]|uniref:Cation/multidrug efflux pump n=1 Tax=Antarcticimicrobium sediminis TaxID=2546227 RepID=A0A4R5ESI8_9RHOB|nr:hypothetical protein [Antarcticimicrobium sediminis]TDE37861.1 hypothetical protein E1B25_10555 [Antarcticimicrobium sediminis]
MLVMLRFLLPLLVGLTVIYIVVSIYSRLRRRRKLAQRWDSKDVLTVDRETFIKRGLERYDRSFKRKLILGVYIVPLTVIAIIVYVTNFM